MYRNTNAVLYGTVLYCTMLYATVAGVLHSVYTVIRDKGVAEVLVDIASAATNGRQTPEEAPRPPTQSVRLGDQSTTTKPPRPESLIPSLVINTKTIGEFRGV